MKLVVERSSLLRALGPVQSVVERRGTLPILANVKIEAKAQTIELTATDMDIAVIESIPVENVSPGAVTVPAHTLYEIVRKLPDGTQVEIAAKENDAQATLRCGNSRFSLPVLPAGEFPVMAEGEFTHHFTLSANECRLLIEKPRFAISTEETRYYLNGVHWHVRSNEQGGVLRAVATDGHRLARVEVAMPQGAANMPGIIIPRKTITEVKKLVDEHGGEIKVAVSPTKIRFICGGATLISKLIDGSFPDYERVVPSGNSKILEVDTQAFSQAVDRVAIVASEKTRGVKFSMAHGKLTLLASTPEQGDASEELEVKYAADPLEIGFNSRYLLEMMTQVEGETAQFLMADPSSPALVRDPADVGALYVIMPMRV